MHISVPPLEPGALPFPERTISPNKKHGFGYSEVLSKSPLTGFRVPQQRSGVNPPQPNGLNRPFRICIRPGSGRPGPRDGQGRGLAARSPHSFHPAPSRGRHPGLGGASAPAGSGRRGTPRNAERGPARPWGVQRGQELPPWPSAHRGGGSLLALSPLPDLPAARGPAAQGRPPRGPPGGTLPTRPRAPGRGPRAEGHGGEAGAREPALTIRAATGGRNGTGAAPPRPGAEVQADGGTRTRRRERARSRSARYMVPGSPGRAAERPWPRPPRRLSLHVRPTGLRPEPIGSRKLTAWGRGWP